LCEQLQVTPGGVVRATLRVLAAAPTPLAAAAAAAVAAGGRLAGLRRMGFGAALGARQLSGDAAAHIPRHHMAPAPVPPPAAAAKPRKPAKRVTWRGDRELVAVRWFIKDDPAVNVSWGASARASCVQGCLPASRMVSVLPGMLAAPDCRVPLLLLLLRTCSLAWRRTVHTQAKQDATLTEDQLRALAAGAAHHHTAFNQVRAEGPLLAGPSGVSRHEHPAAWWCVRAGLRPLCV
jgi:hypothetical protein